jgi:hypothetical protein
MITRSSNSPGAEEVWSVSLLQVFGKTCCRHLRGEGLNDRHRSGRPEKLSRKQKNRLRALLKRKKGGTLRRATAAFNASSRVQIDKETTRRVAQRKGLQHRMRTKKPDLRPYHKAARVAFAQARRPNNFWRKVFWSDEKTFGLRYDQRGQWVEVGEEPEPRRTEKYGTSVRVWGAVGYRGTSRLYKIPKSMTAQDYLAFLRDDVYPDMEETYGKDWIFQQDGDGSHSAAVVRAWLDQQPEDWIEDWPSRSPDFSPIEYLWAIIGQRLVGLRAEAEASLWRHLAGAWEAITPADCRNLADSLPTRLRMAIESGGNPIKY